MTVDRAVVVMGKLPRPGRVKTRLSAPNSGGAIRPEDAARLYAAFLADTFRLVERGPRCRRVFACALASGDSLAEARALVPEGWQVEAQQGDSLGERIEHARAVGRADHVLVMGSDSPTLPHERLEDAFEALEGGSRAQPAHRTAVVVPTEDGGYALIGFAGPAVALLEGIPWSTEAVMDATRRAAGRANVRLVELPPAYDVDHPEDLGRLRRDAAPDRHPATISALAQLP